MSENNQSQELANDVLFQKLGNTWYIFAEVDNEMIYSAMPAGMDPRTTDLELYNVIEEHIKKVADHSRFKSPEAA